MDINFEYYKIFYHVAKYKNITKAATALGSSQPNVTRIMKLLEGQLNCRLFVREARGIRLTEEGAKLYSHVEAAYKHLLYAQEEIGSQSAAGAGMVEIGATETALHLYLLGLLRDFRAAHPKIRLKIHNYTTPEILKELMDANLDVAVITTPFEIPRALHSVQRLEFQEILVGGTQYAHLCRRKLELGEFRDYPWIGLGRGTATYEFYQGFFIRHQIDVELDMEVATSDLLIPLIQNNLGIGFVPEALAQPLLSEGKLVKIELDGELPARTIQVVTDKGRGKSAAADVFYRFLQN